MASGYVKPPCHNARMPNRWKPNVTAAAVIERDGHFLLIEEDTADGLRLNTPAGHLDPGESPLEACVREVLEETGYGGGEWSEFMRVAPNASAANNFSYCFIAENVEKISEQALDKSEDLTVHLFSFEEVKELLENGRIVQATMAAPLWKYIAIHDK